MSKLFDDASLAMIPSAYKDGKLYSIRPTDGSGDFTFSRGSNLAATRVDVNGLIEKGRENLLLQSNQFDTTWINVNSSETGGQSGYDGSSDAWLLTLTGGTATKLITQSLSAFSGIYTASFYAKAGTHSIIQWGVSSQTDVFVSFDLSDGSVGSLSAKAIDASATSVGGGWYRIQVAFQASGAAGYSIAGVDSLSATRYQSTSSTGNFYIQDAQLEAGLVATDYIETGASTAQAGILEDMPRLDYSGSCPALLLEPQRTNLVAHSEYYGSSEWSKRTSDSTAVPVVTNNYAVSPEGVKNASRVVVTKPSTDNDFAVITDFGGVTKSAGDKFASSVYLKATDASQVGKIVDIYSYESGGGYWTIKSHTLTDDWVRVDAVSTANTSTGNVELLNIGKARASAGGTTLANMATDFLVYGAQFEEGSYPTSYIPTYGSSVTRSVDNMDTTFSSPLTSNGNVSVLFDLNAATETGSNSTSNNLEFVFSNGDRIIYNQNTVSWHRIELNVNGGTEFIYKTFGILKSVPVKICVVVTNKEYRIFANGQLTSSVGSFTGTADWTAAERFASDITSTIGVIPMKQLVFFPTALTDSECIALTSL